MCKFALTHPPTPQFAQIRDENTYTWGEKTIHFNGPLEVLPKGTCATLFTVKSINLRTRRHQNWSMNLILSLDVVMNDQGSLDDVNFHLFYVSVTKKRSCSCLHHGYQAYNEFEMLSANERAVDLGLEIMIQILYFIDIITMLRENLQHTPNTEKEIPTV